MLRKIYLIGPIGVNKLRVKYGNKANMGMAPERFVIGSGNIIRKILQQLEKAELVKQDTIKNHKGRVLTTKGRSMMDKLAAQIAPKVKAVEIPKEVKKPEVKEAPKAKEAPKPEAKKEVPKEKKPEVKEKPKEAPKPK
jgi:small subunit ribosomal protein S19e